MDWPAAMKPRPGGTVARGYNAKHKAIRKAMKQLVDSGAAACSRCGKPIDPAEPWDADHTDDRSGYKGPAHRSCNRRAGGIKGNLVRRGLAPQPRRWTL